MSRRRREFAGRVALVTGGAGGIGFACVRRLREGGAKVVVVDQDRRRLAVAARTVGRANVHAADVARAEAARRIVADVAQRLGRLDFLVVAAGICRDAVLWKMTDDDWDRVIDVDLSAAGHFVRAAAPSMRERGFGRIVLISSINGRRGKFGQANYAAAKAGLIGLARSAARELASRDVTVNVVEPGFTETAMTAPLSAEVRQRALAETPLGRAAQPDEVAAAVCFFLGSDASHITGQSLAVDGGQGMGA